VTFLLELKYSEANEIAAALKNIASPNMSIVVYQSLNTIIFSGNSTELEGLVKIAETLDRAVDEEAGEAGAPKVNIHVIHLENSNAEDAAVLSRIPFSKRQDRYDPPSPDRGSRDHQTFIQDPARDQDPGRQACKRPEAFNNRQ
jgi:type II secretory pathway component GspD/PulD (secretin)